MTLSAKVELGFAVLLTVPAVFYWLQFLKSWLGR